VLNEFYDSLADKVDFLFIYITEAHAQDEWPLGNFVNIKQHTSNEERLAAAKEFMAKSKFKYPIVCDTIKNEFCNSYSVWPERWFIINQKKITKIAYPTEVGYSRPEIKRTLESLN